MTQATMRNLLAEIWRENVIALMEHHEVNFRDLIEITGKTDSTVRSNFGGKKMMQAPNVKTVRTIEKAFALHKGTLDKKSYKPENFDSEPVYKKPKPQATLSIPVDGDKLERIMRILMEDR